MSEQVGVSQSGRDFHSEWTTLVGFDLSGGHNKYHGAARRGKTKKEAIRALKRRLFDVVYRHLVADQQPR